MEEWCNVGSCLRNNKVVYVEKLGNSRQWRVSIAVVGLAPGTERYFLCRSPGNDGASLILTFQDDRRVESGG